VAQSMRMKSAPRPKEKAEDAAPAEEASEAFAQSIRFDEKLGNFLKTTQQETNSTVAEIIRGYINDARTFYDVPRPQLEKHIADMENLGVTPREYIRYLLSLRYEAIVLGHVALSAPPGSSTKGR
jgi:hypothetical protein